MLVLALSVTGCTLSRSPVTGQKRAYAYTWEQEIQLGAEADQQIQAAFGVYDDDALQRYVDEVGQAVLANSDMREPGTPEIFRETEFRFRVLDSPVVNAFALPGGYIYVTRGLLAHLNNEAQLAVVLGHEIGHVAARHASQRALEQQFGQLLLIGGAIAGQELLNVPAQDVLNIGGTAAQLLFLQYGRDDERESDNLGVEYAARAGYEAGEGSQFFRSLQRLGEQSGESIPNWLSSHPDPGEREQTIRELAAGWENEVQMNRLGQEELYEQLASIVLGDDPRQGFVEGGVFYHPDLEFQFPIPNGFDVTNQPTQVVMVDRQQRAIQIFTFAQENTARAAAEQFAAQQGIQVVDSGPARSGGLDAFYVLADAQTESGQIARLLSYYVEFGGQIYNFLGYALQDDYATYEAAFERSMQGFAPLTDPAKLNVEPARAEIEMSPRTAEFESFLSASLPYDLTPQGLAIMNQVDLQERIQEGRLLKMVRYEQ